MNEEVDQWTSKAEGDFSVASREITVAANNSFDAVCFHAQQCIEKLMKAVLVQHGSTPPRTHGLIELDELIRSLNPDWACERKDLRFLTRGGVAFRYPGESAERIHAETSMAICRRLRETLLNLLEDNS